MTNKSSSATYLSQAMIYQIRIKGHLNPQWTGWFEDLAIMPQENGDTLISGPVVDQAALYGLLRKVRDLGLPLLSVMSVEPGHAVQPDTNQAINHKGD